MLVSKVIFCVVLNFIICMLILLQYIKWRNWITFTQFHCHSPHHDPSSKDVMSAMSPRHQKWYIQKDLCLIHSEFPFAIEASIVHCLSTRPTRSFREICWWPQWVAMLKNQEPAARWFFSGFLLNFQHGTQPFIILFRASGLERLVPANIWCLDILGALCWHNY